MFLATAVARFLRQLEADGRSPSTVAVYGRELKRFVQRTGSRARVERISPDAIARFVTSPVATVSPDGTKRSTRTVNRTRSVLRLFFSFLEQRGTLRRSPARLLRNGRTDRPVPVMLTRAETRQLIHALDVVAAENDIGRRDRVLFTVLLRSGMRISAALALDVEDLDLASGTAVSHGKHGRTQIIYFPKPVATLLRHHLKETGAHSGPVFRSCRGARLSARGAQYRFRALTTLAGITRPVTVHSLRHSFAANLRKKTRDLRIVQAALGHRDIQSTQVYCQLAEEEVRRAVAL